MRGERVDNHDKVCCEYYAALLAMGAYDVEFMLFGTVYLEAGRKKCFISADRSVVYQFVEDCRTKGIYPSMVHRKIKRCRVNSGERELVEQNFKLEFGRELNKLYSKEVLLGLQQFAVCQSNNNAAETFDLLRDQLSGCFDEDALQLFESALYTAFEAKILKWEEFYCNITWLEMERDFLCDKIRASSNFKRTFAGFAYVEYGKVKYYTNAVVEKTAERRMELMAKQLLVTPLYTKTYYFNDLAELQHYIKVFDTTIVDTVDASYLRLIDKLKQLQTDIDHEAYMTFYEKAMANCTLAEKLTLQYYSNVWNQKLIEAAVKK